MSAGSVCVTCKLNVTGPQDLCDPDLCWCHDITNKEKLLDCGKRHFLVNCLFFSSLPAFILDPEEQLMIVDSAGDVFTQTITYSGDQYNARSLKLEVPQHQGGETAFDQLTVVMHAARSGPWHQYGLKVLNGRRLNTCA